MHGIETLLLWSDMNKNAVVDYFECNNPDCNPENYHCNENGCTNELKTMEEAGIEEISVDYKTNHNEKNLLKSDEHGNIVAHEGSFKMKVKEIIEKIEYVTDELTLAVEEIVVKVEQWVVKTRQAIDVFFTSLE